MDKANNPSAAKNRRRKREKEMACQRMRQQLNKWMVKGKAMLLIAKFKIWLNPTVPIPCMTHLNCIKVKQQLLNKVACKINYKKLEDITYAITLDHHGILNRCCATVSCSC